MNVLSFLCVFTLVMTQLLSMIGDLIERCVGPEFRSIRVVQIERAAERSMFEARLDYRAL